MKSGPKPKYEHLNCAGWYGILYKPNDKFHYIGCSKNIKQRWRSHRTETKDKHYTDEFHKDLRANLDKYECVVLLEYDGVIKDHHDLHEKLVPTERFLIEHFKLLGHPIVSPAENQNGTYERTEEHKAKLSASHKGKIPWNKGKHLTDETKAKMRAAKIGYIPWNKGKTSK